MRRRHYSLISALILLTLVVSGLGWQVCASVRQKRLNHALIAAIKQNDTKQALSLLAEGADPNSKDEPPPHLTLWQLFLETLRGKRAVPSDAHSALLLACSGDDKNGIAAPDNPILVKALLDRGAAMEVTDKDEPGMTPLLYACLERNTKVSTLLIESGANLNAATPSGDTPLIYSALANNKVLVRLLLNKNANVNVDAVGGMHYSDITPLIAAQLTGTYKPSLEDDPTITEWLLSRGANVNGPEAPLYGPTDTPLTAAIDYNRIKSVRLLIEHGANVNLKTMEGTPLKWAKMQGRSRIIQMLKQAGAKE